LGPSLWSAHQLSAWLELSEASLFEDLEKSKERVESLLLDIDVRRGAFSKYWLDQVKESSIREASSNNKNSNQILGKIDFPWGKGLEEASVDKMSPFFSAEVLKTLAKLTLIDRTLVNLDGEYRKVESFETVKPELRVFLARHPAFFPLLKDLVNHPVQLMNSHFKTKHYIGFPSPAYLISKASVRVKSILMDLATEVHDSDATIKVSFSDRLTELQVLSLKSEFESLLNTALADMLIWTGRYEVPVERFKIVDNKNSIKVEFVSLSNVEIYFLMLRIEEISAKTAKLAL